MLGEDFSRRFREYVPRKLKDNSGIKTKKVGKHREGRDGGKECRSKHEELIEEKKLSTREEGKCTYCRLIA